MEQNIAVRLEHVRREYGDVVAVDDVSLDIHDGEIFGVIGPNGAGKTTLVNMICGMVPPSTGRVRTLGFDPTKEERKLREILGVQFQEAELPGAITVKEALELYSSFYRNPRNWHDLAEEWGLQHKLGARFEKLSGGQKQRLFICLALLNKPKLVVLDELTTGLDPNARRQSWELVKQIRDGGATVLLVTHFMEEAEYLADRIALINQGVIEAMGTPEELTRQHTDRRVVTFTSPGFDPGALAHLGTVSTNNDRIAVEGGRFLMAEVAATLRDMDIDPVDLSTQHTSLEDLFISLTGGSTMEEA